MNRWRTLPFALGVGSLVSMAVPSTAFAQHGGGGGGHGGGGGGHGGGGGGFHGGGFREGGGHPEGGFHGGGRPVEPGFHEGVGVRVGPGFHGEHFGGERVHIVSGVGFGRPHWGNGFWGWRNNSWVWLAGPYWVTPDYPDWVWVGAQWVWDGQQWVWQEGYWAPSN
jgi:hypothetical protein